MNNFFFIFILFSAAIEAQVLSREECSPIDIRSTNPLIKKSSTLKNHFTVPRNQDSIGWCYGFSAADLLSAHLGEGISSFHVSALYNRKARNNIFMRLGHGIGRKFTTNSFDEVYEGGMCKMALDETMKNGKVCKEKAMPFDYPHERQTMDMITSLESIRKARKEYSVLLHKS